jgi:hypothetical protein
VGKYMAILAEMADSWEFLGIFGNFMGIFYGSFLSMASPAS